MIRTLILVLAILAVAAAPLPAHARGGGHGSHGHHGHHHGHHHGQFHHFGGLYAYTPFPYDYPCWWERGHWVDQLYMDKYGYTTTLSQWVPGQWMCW